LTKAMKSDKIIWL